MEPRDLSSHEEYMAGRGNEEVAAEYGLDPTGLVTLSSNENPLGPSDRVVETIRDRAPTVNRYPKAAHTELTEQLANHWSVDTDQVWLTSGGDGSIDYLTRAMLAPGERVLVPTPGFAYYAMSARYHHGGVKQYPIAVDDKTGLSAAPVLDAYAGERIVYMTTPHNPTGQTMSLSDLRSIAENTDTNTLLVVDEAYGEFADGPSARQLIDERDDVAVLRSFSKAYGLAGMRLGYTIVPSAWASAYRRVNTPFAVNELACRAGQVALDDEAHLEKSVELAQWGRSVIGEELSAPTWPSQGNFVLADVGDAAAVTESLLHRGILVRDCTSFGLDHCIRISIGTKSAVRQAVTACNEVLEVSEGQSK